MGNVNQGIVFAFASLWSFFKMSFVVVVVVDSSEAFVGRMSRYYGSVIGNCTWYSKGKQEGITGKLFTGYAVLTECSLIVMKKKNVFLSQLAERFFRLKVVLWRGTLKFVGLSKKYHPLTPCMYACAFNIKSKYAGNHSSLWQLSVNSLSLCLLNFLAYLVKKRSVHHSFGLIYFGIWSQK